MSCSNGNSIDSTTATVMSEIVTCEGTIHNVVTWWKLKKNLNNHPFRSKIMTAVNVSRTADICPRGVKLNSLIMMA